MVKRSRLNTGALWCDWYSCPGVTIFMFFFGNDDFPEKNFKKVLRIMFYEQINDWASLKPDNWLIFGLKWKLDVSRRDDFGSIFKIGFFQNEKRMQIPMGQYQGK